MSDFCQSSSDQSVAARASLLTAAATAALAVIRVQGTHAATILGSCLASPDAVHRAMRRGLAVARWHDRETVVLRALGPDEFEISCHGGQAAVNRLLADLAHAGARIVEPAELLAHGSTFERELADRFAYAPSTAAAFMLAAQKKRWQALIDELRSSPLRAAKRLSQLARRAHLGLRLFDPWRVALVGRPNAGKSSLLNAVVGYTRAVVHEQPGTTRDVVREQVVFQGWPLVLHDTAGLRRADDLVEQEGVRRAEDVARTADLVWLVLDRSAPLCPADRTLLRTQRRMLVVLSKVDLPAVWSEDELPEGMVRVRTSAVTRQGIRELLLKSLELLLGSSDPLQSTDPCPVTQRQVELVHAAARKATQGQFDAAIAMLRQLVEE